MKKLHLIMAFSIIACSSSQLLATTWQTTISGWNQNLKQILDLRASNPQLATFKSYSYLDLYLKELAKAKGVDFKQTFATSGIRGVNRKFKDAGTAMLLHGFLRHAREVSKLVKVNFVDGANSIHSAIKRFLSRYQKITTRSLEKSEAGRFKEIRAHFDKIKVSK